jgi:NarL family two-component system sensor histidine kinase YdfH
MKQTLQQKGQFSGIPFYIFISLLLSLLAVFGALAVFQSSSLPVVLLYILLFAIHIGLYWLNLKRFQNKTWAISYYIIQAFLIVVLVNFPYGGAGVRVSILGSAVLCMIGESLGLWGNTKRALFLGIAYTALGLVLLYFAVGPANFGVAVSSLFVNSTFLVLLMVVLNQEFAQRAKAEELAETLESANAKLAAYSARIESLTLQNERQRMARELHDTLAQGVAGLVLQLEAVRAHLASNRVDRASSIVDQALTRARSTLAESRGAIDNLRAAPVNLTEAVRERVDRFTQATGIPCELDLALQEKGLSNEISEHALNILSEALANVARHAQATKVNVKFIVQGNQLELEVHDNGRGFDVNQQVGAGHYGLLGIRERARLMGGALRIKSDPQSGTIVHFVASNLQGGGLQ